jgi:hypothetical protein
MKRGSRVDDVRRVIDEVLCPRGFRRSAGADHVENGSLVDDWVRENSWRRDRFHVEYRAGSPDQVAVSVSIALLPSDGEPVQFDAGDLAFLVGRVGVAVWYPGREGSSRPELTEMLAEDAARVIRWFDRVADPEMALRTIREKKERERWTHLGRFNKIVAALEVIGTTVGKLAGGSESQWVERPAQRGLLADILDSDPICRVRRVPGGRRVEIVLRSGSRSIGHELTVIAVARPLAVALGASLPAGFVALATPAAAEDEVWWGTSGVAIPEDGDLVVSIPCQSPLAGQGKIRLGIQSRGAIGKLSRMVELEIGDES